MYCRGNPAPAALPQHLEGITEVVEAYTVAGAADAILHVFARDIAHLEQAIQQVREVRVIDRTETVVVLSCLINRPRPYVPSRPTTD